MAMRAKLTKREKDLIARNVQALGWRETARRIEAQARRR